MIGTKELDLRNSYEPDLNNIQESAERTYGEANSFFRKEELYLKDIETRIVNGELLLEKDIYDECNAIASDLAKCCEMYLKAIYINENNIPINSIETIWEKLKSPEFQTDEKGNLIYQTIDGNLTYAKYNNNEPELDSNGKIIYTDANGNIYTEKNRGSKIKRNGHQLDRLIDSLSVESRLLLELRMLAIPMQTTEQNQKITFLDYLHQKGVISLEKFLTKDEYLSWIDQHKKTFEQARYSGQKKYDINIEFLYHLVTQIKAVAQYIIKPEPEQKFIIKEELLKLPKGIQKLSSIDSNLISEKLINLILNDEKAFEKITILTDNRYVDSLKNIKSNLFFDMINEFDLDELIYVTYLCFENDFILEGKVKVVSYVFFENQFTNAQLINLSLQLKRTSMQESIVELLKSFFGKISADNINYILQENLNSILQIDKDEKITKELKKEINCALNDYKKEIFKMRFKEKINSFDLVEKLKK